MRSFKPLISTSDKFLQESVRLAVVEVLHDRQPNQISPEILLGLNPHFELFERPAVEIFGTRLADDEL